MRLAYNTPMKRSRRWTFNASTCISLGLLAAAATLWVRSYGRIDRAFWARPQIKNHQTVFEFDSTRGLTLWRVVSLEGFDLFNPPRHGWNIHSTTGEIASFLIPDARTFLGFGIKQHFYRPLTLSRSSLPMQRTYDTLSVPYWFLVILFGLLPGIWFIQWRRQRKLEPNACPQCAYDLTGNETGVCPECGTQLEVRQ